jgi:hypothetical protein
LVREDTNQGVGTIILSQKILSERLWTVCCPLLNT